MSLRQEAEALFFGVGVQELYGHWSWADRGSMFMRFGEWEPGQAPDTWAYRVHAPHPLDSERRIDKVITYSVLYTAAELIAYENVDTEVGLDGHDRLLRLAAARWRRLVATKKTGFPLIDGD